MSDTLIDIVLFDNAVGELMADTGKVIPVPSDVLAEVDRRGDVTVVANWARQHGHMGPSQELAHYQAA